MGTWEIYVGLSENSVPHCTQWFSWPLSLLNGYNWGYTPFSDMLFMLSTKSMGFGKRHLPQSQLFDQTSSFFNLQIHDLHWLSTTHSKKMSRTGLPHLFDDFWPAYNQTSKSPAAYFCPFKRMELLRRSLPRLKSVQRRLPRTWEKMSDCNRWVKVLGNPIPMSHCCG